MPTYLYKAKDKTQTITGELEGDSEDGVILQLEKLGYLPIKVVPKSSMSQEQPAKLSLPTIHGKISPKEQNAFTKQLAGLVKSKIPILKALEIIIREARHAGLKQVVQAVHERVKNGVTLSAAIDEQRCFSRVYVNLVAAGEKGGMLQNVLLNLVEWSDKEEETRSKLKSAMAYPLLMMLVGIGTVATMIVFVIPQLVLLYSNIGQELPLSTRCLLAVSRLIRHQWYWLAGVALLALLATRKSGVLISQRVLLARLMMSVPFFGDYILQRDIGRFCRTLGMLLSGGIAIREAVDSAVPTLGNAALESEMSGLSDDLAAGLSFSKALQKIERFPSYAISLISVSEEAGQLHDALKDTALVYDKATDERLRLFSSLLEPLLILGIGSVVGFIVIAMLMPIFQFNLK